MSAVIAEPVLRSASWDDLGRMWSEAVTDAEREEVLSEGKRRDRLEAQQRERDAERDEWEAMALAQYAAAEAQCNGYLIRHANRVRHVFAESRPRERKVNPDDNDAAEIKARRQSCATCGHGLRHPWHEGTDPFILWEGTEEWARKYASEELCALWDASPRVTVTQYREQISNGKRIQRDQRDAETTQEPTEGETVIGGIVGHMAERAAVDAVRAGVRTASGLDRAQRAQMNAQQAIEQRAGEIRTGLAVRAPAALVKREPLDGDQILRDARKVLRHFALWPSEAALTTATLAVAAMHAKDPESGLPVWEYAFRLLFTGPYGSGKSWFAKLVASLCPSGKVLLEPTKPSLIDMIADLNTVVVTEVDELLATPGRNRGIVAIINASYESGHYHTRKAGGKVQEVHLFGHMILDGADLTRKTNTSTRAIVTRSLALHVKTAPDGYRRPRWDKTAQAIAARGRDRLAAWMAQEVADGIADVIPELPEDLGSPRRCALWEPLFTVALRADLGAAKRDGREDDPECYWTKAISEASVQIESALGLADEEEDSENELDKIMSSWEE